MKWSYVICFAAGILFFTLLTWSPWWLLGGAVVFMAVWAYRIYSERLFIFEAKSAALEKEIHDLQTRLDHSINREQRLTRVTEQAMEMKRQLMATVKQEVRTPVNGMVGLATLLTETPLTEQQGEYIHGILHCGEQLVAVVNHILVDDMLHTSLTGQEAGRLVEDQLDLRSCVKEVLDMFAVRTGETGPVLSCDIAEEIPLQLVGDSSRLKQLLINLVDNAVRHTSEGEIQVAARMLRKKEDGRVELAFEVRDTGTGIPASKIERIFEGLSPANSAGAREDNPGLGLVVCRRLVEMMDGSIEVQSSPGEGCVFSFTVCLNTDVDHEIRQPVRMDRRSVVTV
ncbi:MAG TPA: ATP-binding protein [Puia sp.]|nr:ATP-binding protein [Puia sp.]